jgi:hypothetical protein
MVRFKLKELKEGQVKQECQVTAKTILQPGKVRGAHGNR